MAKKEAENQAKTDEFVGKGTLKLRKPLTVDGKQLAQIHYNFDELTALDLIEADKDRATMSNNVVMIEQFDTTAKLCIFARAVSKAMPEVSLADLKRMGGHDAQEAMILSRRFFTVQIEDGEEETTEAQ